MAILMQIHKHARQSTTTTNGRKSKSKGKRKGNRRDLEKDENDIIESDDKKNDTTGSLEVYRVSLKPKEQFKFFSDLSLVLQCHLSYQSDNESISARFVQIEIF